MPSLIKYLKESQEELKKVIWPNREQTTKHTALVVGVSVLVAAFLGGVDFVLTQVVEYIVNR